MRERDVERQLVTGVKKLGGVCLKFVSPGSPGVPDRIIVLPNGRTLFVELKTEVGRLSRMQQYRIAELQTRKADVRIVYGAAAVRELLLELQREVARNAV